MLLGRFISCDLCALWEALVTIVNPFHFSCRYFLHLLFNSKPWQSLKEFSYLTKNNPKKLSAFYEHQNLWSIIHLNPFLSLKATHSFALMVCICVHDGSVCVSGASGGARTSVGSRPTSSIRDTTKTWAPMPSSRGPRSQYLSVHNPGPFTHRRLESYSLKAKFSCFCGIFFPV